MSISDSSIVAPVKLIECPRDAMQGWQLPIPTRQKADYINALLKVGFDTIDFGSFVSAKAIPQMADTREVIGLLNKEQSGSKLLAIVANQRGAEEAAAYEAINCLGFPFSVSETFQQRNTNSSIDESLHRVAAIQQICHRHHKQLVVYISMGFGNPYGDPYTPDIVFHWVQRIVQLGVTTISLADTVGLADPEGIYSIVHYLVNQLPQHEIGVHLHSRPDNWKAKLDAALKAGCNRVDGTLKGIGGCPMAHDELVGNMNSEWMIPYLQELNRLPPLHAMALSESIDLAGKIFVQPKLL